MCIVLLYVIFNLALKMSFKPACHSTLTKILNVQRDLLHKAEKIQQNYLKLRVRKSGSKYTLQILQVGRDLNEIVKWSTTDSVQVKARTQKL